MGKRPTIQMVADRSGVSRGTVDRVLNNRAYVNAEVRSRVLAAIKELGYISPQEAHKRELLPELKPLRLGVLLPNWDPFFEEEVTAGIERARRALEDFHTDVLVRRCKTDLPSEARELLDELVAQGCKGISLCALNDPSIAEKIRELTGSGIPCVTFNSDIPKSGRLCFVGEDILRTGRVAGELMSRLVPKGSHILAAVGNLKFDGHKARFCGFKERVTERGFGEEELKVIETFNDYTLTLERVSTALSEDPNLRGIYMANLSVTACAEAVRRAGLAGEVHIVCHDINESICRLLKEGAVDFTIPQDMKRHGYLPLMILRDYLSKGQKPTEKHLTAHIEVLCAENLDAD